MARIQAGRWTHDAGTDVVVFLIGMRVNKPWRPDRWFPALVAMGPMLKELTREERGLLGYQQGLMMGGPAIVQYWRSPEELYAYATDRDALHRPAWAEFNRRARAGDGAVGVWHETYVVPAGSQETIYVDMPATGLASVVGSVPVARRGESGRERLGGPRTGT